MSAACIDAENEDGYARALGIDSRGRGAVRRVSVDLEIAFIQHLEVFELRLYLLGDLMIDIAWLASAGGHEHGPTGARGQLHGSGAGVGGGRDRPSGGNGESVAALRVAVGSGTCVRGGGGLRGR